MIDAELFARIRRLYFAEHWRAGTIGAELGIHHDTVECAIGADRFGTRVLHRALRRAVVTHGEYAAGNGSFQGFDHEATMESTTPQSLCPPCTLACVTGV